MTPLPEELHVGLVYAGEQGHFQQMNHVTKVCYGKKMHLFGLGVKFHVFTFNPFFPGAPGGPC